MGSLGWGWEQDAEGAEGWEGGWAERPTYSERGGLRVEVASLRYAESVTIRQGSGVESDLI